MARPARQYHHGNLRSALIEAAIPLLEAHGPAALSLREVAKAAGVSHAAPYRHFRDKTELLEEIAVRGYDTLSQACQRAQRLYAADPAKQLVEAGVGYLLFVVEQPRVAHLMFGGMIELNACGELLQQAADTAFKNLVAIVESGVQAGVFKAAPAKELTIAAWSMVHGLATLITSGMLGGIAGNRREVRRLGRELAKTLLHGMLAE
jgi:AcrR family transcriptional regulator